MKYCSLTTQCLGRAEAFLAHHPWQSNHPHSVPDHSEAARQAVEKRGGTKSNGRWKGQSKQKTGVLYTGTDTERGEPEKDRQKREVLNFCTRERKSVWEREREGYGNIHSLYRSPKKGILDPADASSALPERGWRAYSLHSNSHTIYQM